MDQKNLELLEKIRDTLEEIKELQEDMELGSPAAYLQQLEKIRDALADIQEAEDSRNA